MKKVLIIFLLLLPISVNATIYWVTPRGNDSNTGADSSSTGAWLTWNKAFTAATAGDTVYFRGGVYQTTVINGTGIQAANSGTADDWIVYEAYPDDFISGNYPILDCDNIVAGDILYTGLQNYGLVVGGRYYIKLKGLTVRNVKQYYNRNYGVGIQLSSGYVVVENCIAYNCWGVGMRSSHSSSDENDTTQKHFFINCDAFNICDSITGDPLGSNAGNVGSGFTAYNNYSTGGATYYYNCRAWNCSDQGFNVSGNHYIECDGCWSFGNKRYVNGTGGGFKLGWLDFYSDRLRRKIVNCVIAYNDTYGMLTNDSHNAEGVGIGRMQIYNNLVYRNGYDSEDGWGYGIIVQNAPDGETSEGLKRLFYNNISWDNKNYNIFDYSGAVPYTHSNNSWDGGATITSGDFRVLPTTDEMGVDLLSGSRDTDWSLLDLGGYFQLSLGSDAIEAGIDVGLTYDGNGNEWDDPPSIGAFEFFYPYSWMMNNYFYLPPITDTMGIPFIAGKTDILYANTMANIPNEVTDLWDVEFVCDIGSQVGDNFVITPTSADVGLHDITVNYIYTADESVFATQTSKIRVYREVVDDTVTLLSFGDSNMTNYFDEEMRATEAALDSILFITIGHQDNHSDEGYYHSAVSGAGYHYFATSVNSPFVYGGVIDLAYYFANRELPTPNVIPTIVHIRDETNNMLAYVTEPMSESYLDQVFGWLENLVDAFLAYDAGTRIILSIAAKPTLSEATWDAAYPSLSGYSWRYIENMQRFTERLIREYSNPIYNRRVFVSYDGWRVDRANTTNVHTTRAGNYQVGLGFANTLNAVISTESLPEDEDPPTGGETFLKGKSGVMQKGKSGKFLIIQ